MIECLPNDMILMSVSHILIDANQPSEIGKVHQ